MSSIYNYPKFNTFKRSRLDGRYFRGVYRIFERGEGVQVTNMSRIFTMHNVPPPPLYEVWGFPQKAGGEGGGAGVSPLNIALILDIALDCCITTPMDYTNNTYTYI